MPRYKLTPRALKQMQKLDMEIRRKIFKKLDYFMSSTNPLDFAEPIADPTLGKYRFRIGDFRVIFDVEGDLYKILIVGDRKDIYR